MKILNDVKGFFRAKYLSFINFLSAQRLNFMEFLTAHFMQCTFNMVQRLDKLKSKNVEPLTLQLVNFSFDKVRKFKSQEDITAKFVEFSAELMRNLVVFKGKDPDHIFPLPLVPKPLTLTEQLEKELKERRARQTTAFAFSSWSHSGFKTASHPIVKLRTATEEKQAQAKLNAPEPLQVVVAPAVMIGQHEPVLEVKESDLPLPVITESAPTDTDPVLVVKVED